MNHMDEIVNHVMMRVESWFAKKSGTRVGVVTAVKSVQGRLCIKASVQPDNTPTQWIPLKCLAGGLGWGLYMPVDVGTQVLLHPLRFSSLSYVADGFVPGISTAAASNVANGEMLLVSKSGGVISLKADGNIYSKGTTWAHDGDFVATGNIYDGNKAGGSLADLRTAYNAHTNSGKPIDQPHVPTSPGSPVVAPVGTWSPTYPVS